LAGAIHIAAEAERRQSITRRWLLRGPQGRNTPSHRPGAPRPGRRPAGQILPTNFGARGPNGVLRVTNGASLLPRLRLAHLPMSLRAALSPSKGGVAISSLRLRKPGSPDRPNIAPAGRRLPRRRSRLLAMTDTPISLRAALSVVEGRRSRSASAIDHKPSVAAGFSLRLSSLGRGDPHRR
jgi:hypothetical protein